MFAIPAPVLQIVKHYAASRCFILQAEAAIGFVLLPNQMEIKLIN